MKTIDLTGLSPEIIAYITKLESQVKEQSTQLEVQTKTVENQKVRIDKLMTMLANFQKTLYGQSSEKSKYVLGEDSNQLSLFNEAEAVAKRNAPEPDKVSVAGHTRKAKRTKEELTADLPVVEILCDLNEDEQICEKCGSELRVLGKETVREELEIIPAQVRVLRYIRQNFVCKRCETETGAATIVKPPTPAPVIKRSLASASTVAHVMYQKYVNGMPLNRQEKDWAYQGVMLSRATLANWVIRAATDWLMPLWEIMKSHLLKQAVISADETVIQVLKEEGKTPTSNPGCGSTVLVIREIRPWCCLSTNPAVQANMRDDSWKDFTECFKLTAIVGITRFEMSPDAAAGLIIPDV